MPPRAEPDEKRHARSWLAYLSIFVLLAIAGMQISLAEFSVLTPWKGGGFGMFSTIDSSAYRVLRVYALAPGEERRVDLPASLAGPAYSIACFPTQNRLLGFAKRIAQHLSPKSRGVRALRIEVWRPTFDSETATLGMTLWRTARYEIPHGSPH